MLRGRGYTMDQFEGAPKEIQEVPAGVYERTGFTGGLEDLLPRVEKHVIPDAAHWLQQEKPAEVNALLVPWLQRNFA